jgi:hypothetical protein
MGTDLEYSGTKKAKHGQDNVKEVFRNRNRKLHWG